MIEVLEKLLVLQDRDRRIMQLKQEQIRIPQLQRAVDQRLQQESAKLEELRNRLKQLEAERKKLELEAEAKRNQVAKYRSQLMQIKSNVEYQALLKEIAEQEAAVRQVEDRELELMEQAEQLQPVLQEETVLVRELTGKAAAEKEQLRQRGEQVARELAELQAERQKLAGALSGDVLYRYERLLRSKGDAAVVPVVHGNCGGCHLSVAPQTINNARYGTELTSCDYCGRILYWQAQ